MSHRTLNIFGLVALAALAFVTAAPKTPLAAAADADANHGLRANDVAPAAVTETETETETGEAEARGVTPASEAELRLSPFLSAAAALEPIDRIVAKPLLWCRRLTTTELLGYLPYSSIPVYQGRCSGLCLSLYKYPRECRERRRTILVSSTPAGYYGATPGDLGKASSRARVTALKKVSLVEGCDCKPKRCEVLNEYGGTDVYEHGQTVIDGCDRRCRCSYGQLVDCCRQRKDLWYGMSAAERLRYAQAVRTVSTDPAYKPTYDAIVADHELLFGSNIHNHEMFLPWHRAYILRLENLLRQVDCRVTVPYWAWARQASDPLGSGLFGPGSPFGGDGDPGSGNCVTTGLFAWPGWTTTPSDGSSCLRRNFSPGATMATWADLQSDLMLACPTADPAGYTCFRVEVEHGSGKHDHGHCIVNGQMCSTAAANDPLFFLHHCMIDRIWAKWQALSPAHVNAYDGNLNLAMPGSPYRPIDVMDLNNQPNGVRVCYVEPLIWWWLDAVFQAADAELLGGIPRVKVLPQQAAEDKEGNPTQWATLLGAMGLRDGQVAKLVRKQQARNSGDAVPLVEAASLENASAALGLELPASALRLVGGRLVLEGCLDESNTVPEADIPDLPCPGEDPAGGGGRAADPGSLPGATGHRHPRDEM